MEFTFLSRWQPQLLSVLRIITGLLFFSHGTSKLLGFPHVDMFDGLQIFSFMGLAGILELVGGILITIGLFTRLTAFILSGEMAIAYFMFHAPMSFHPVINMGEAAILYCFVFLYIAAAGAGPWSADAARSKS
ncbi:DoxX family protein [soil metagenome]